MPFSAGKNQVGGILDPSQTTLTLNQRRTMERLIGQGIDRAVARQLAIALVKTALAKADGHVPPQGVRAACRRGLELAGEYGGPGLTDGAKSRARSMAAGEAQTDEQLARVKSFLARHDSYAKQSSPPSPGYVSWLLWGGDAAKSWSKSAGEKTEKSAVALAKSALARVRIAKRSYHEAFSAACKEILPQGVVDKIHVRARAIAGGHGKAAARAAAQAESTDMTKSDAKPMGAAFARAKATGKDQSHAARKRRANKFLREKGHAPIGKDVKKTAPLPADIRAEQFLKLARQRRKKREADKEPVAKAGQVDLSVPTTIIKAEETQWQKLLWSVVYEPDVFDSHGDRMDAATIQKAAHEAFRQGMYVNHEHVGPPIGAHIVESFTAPVDFTIDDSEGAHVIRKGTWVVGTQVTDDAVWDKVLKGEYGGVSLEGTAFARTIDAEAA